MKLTILLTGVILNLGASANAEENHLQEAVKHAMMASKATNGEEVAKHAQESQKHAQAADEHLDAGLESLKKAIDSGNGNDGNSAQQAAEEATEHLMAAQ